MIYNFIIGLIKNTQCDNYHKFDHNFKNIC